MVTAGHVQARLWAEATPLVPGESVWGFLFGTLVIWGLIAFAAYLVIRLAVRHALQDVARASASDVERRARHVDAE
jgi:hypothetical protein